MDRTGSCDDAIGAPVLDQDPGDAGPQVNSATVLFDNFGEQVGELLRSPYRIESPFKIVTEQRCHLAHCQARLLVSDIFGNGCEETFDSRAGYESVQHLGVGAVYP